MKKWFHDISSLCYIKLCIFCWFYCWDWLYAFNQYLKQHTSTDTWILLNVFGLEKSKKLVNIQLQHAVPSIGRTGSSVSSVYVDSGFTRWLNILLLNTTTTFLQIFVMSSVKLHRPCNHGGAYLHQFPAAVVCFWEKPACSHPAPPALWVRLLPWWHLTELND